MGKYETVRIGTTGDYRPFSWWTEIGRRPEGFCIDVMQGIADLQHWELEFIATSWPSLSMDCLNGKFDIAVGGITNTVERGTDFTFSTTLVLDGKIPLINVANVSEFDSIEAIDLPGVRVVTNPGGSNESVAKELIKNAMLTVVPNIEELFQMLVDGSADAFLTDRIEAIFRTSIHPSLVPVQPTRLLREVPKAFMFSKENSDLGIQVNESIEELRESGSMSAIKRRWLPPLFWDELRD